MRITCAQNLDAVDTRHSRQANVGEDHLRRLAIETRQSRFHAVVTVQTTEAAGAVNQRRQTLAHFAGVLDDYYPNDTISRRRRFKFHLNLNRQTCNSSLLQSSEHSKVIGELTRCHLPGEVGALSLHCQKSPSLHRGNHGVDACPLAFSRLDPQSSPKFFRAPAHAF